RHPVDRDRVLVEPGGKPEGPVHPQPEGLGAQFLVAGSQGSRDERAQHGDPDGEPDPAEGEVMGGPGIHPPEKELEEDLVHDVLMPRGTPTSGAPLIDSWATRPSRGAGQCSICGSAAWARPPTTGPQPHYDLLVPRRSQSLRMLLKRPHTHIP